MKDLDRVLDIVRELEKLKRMCEWHHLKNEDDTETREKLKRLDTEFHHIKSQLESKLTRADKYGEQWKSIEQIIADYEIILKAERERKPNPIIIESQLESKLADAEKFNQMTTEAARNFDIEDIVWKDGEYDFKNWFAKLAKLQSQHTNLVKAIHDIKKIIDEERSAEFELSARGVMARIEGRIQNLLESIEMNG